MNGTIPWYVIPWGDPSAEKPTADVAYVAGVSDVSISDTLRSNPDTSLGWPLQNISTSSPQDVPPGDARATSEVPTNSQAPRSWDQLSWLEKSKTYLTSILPGAVADTFGMSSRPGAVTVSDTLRSAAGSVAGTFNFGNLVLVLMLGAAGLFLVLLILRRA